MSKITDKINEISEKSDFLDEVKKRKNNRSWIRKSQMISVAILKELRRKNMSQVQLAEKLDISPQQVNKLVKGKENLTLETIAKIETALDIKLIEISTKQNKIESEYNFIIFKESKRYTLKSGDKFKSFTNPHSFNTLQ